MVVRADEFYALLQRSDERARIVRVLKELFRIFLKDWFRWEVFGWVLAIFLGYRKEDIMRAPELGWFAKAVVASVLLQSKKREERLLGRALLYHTELPPRELFLRYSAPTGETSLVPAIIYHYRISAQDEGVLEDAVKIAEEIARRLEGEAKND